MGNRSKRRGALAQDIVQSVPKGAGKLTGVGFKCTKEMAANLEPIRKDVTVIHKEYVGKPKEYRNDETVLSFYNDMTKAVITVGDSKEGKLPCSL